MRSLARRQKRFFTGEKPINWPPAMPLSPKKSTGMRRVLPGSRRRLPPRNEPLYQKLLAFRFLERGTRVHACVSRCAPWFLWAWREQADQSPHGRDGRAPLCCLEKSNFIEPFVLSISYKSAFRIKNPRRKWEKMHTDPYLGIGGFLLCVLVVIPGDFKNHKGTKTRRR